MSRRSRAAVALLVACAAGAAASSLGVLPARAATPTLTVDPATNLVNGQFVKVTYTGLAPNAGYGFRECIAAAVNVSNDCASASTTTGVTDNNGNGENYLQILGGGVPIPTQGSPAPPAQPQTITCDANDPCNLVMVPHNSDLKGAILALLSFSPAPDNCPQPHNDILGVGSSSAFSAIYRWEGAECLKPDSIKVGFTGGAIDDYLQPFYNNVNLPAPNTVAFGVTGPQPQMPTPPAGSGLTFKFAPLTASGVVLAYLMYDNNGAQITSLTLTPDLIAKIMLGKIPNWNATKAIKALNPSVPRFPPRILAYHRAESTSVNYVMSSWLAANAPTTWVSLPDNNGTVTPLGADPLFPSAQAGSFANGVTGANGIGFKMATFAPSDPLDQGSVGFMDSSTAAFYGLPTVQIKRADGSVTPATTATISQAITDDTANSDGTLNIDYANTDPNAYPLAMPTYMVAPTNTLDPKAGATLASFLRYAVQGGQVNEPAGYAPLPASMVKTSLAVADAIPVPVPAPVVPPVVTPVPTLGFGALVPHLPLLNSLLPALPAVGLPAAPGLPGSTQAASTCPAGTKTSSTCTGAAAAPPLLSLPGAQRFGHIADWSAARYVLPSLSGLGALALVLGLALALLARWRRVRIGRL